MHEIPDHIADALRDLRRAIQDKGPVPRHHDEIMAEHRAEWPRLWDAIDRLMQP